MLTPEVNSPSIEDISIPLETDGFLRTLIREPTRLLKDLAGLDDISGYICVVEQNIGKQIDTDYNQALQVLSLSQLAY